MKKYLRAIQMLLLTAVLAIFQATATLPSPATADTSPPSGTPATVSADPLPTVQIDNGAVWSQAMVGNIVYVGGDFHNARPAGAAPGTNQTPRTDLLAYDITTGNLIASFNHTLNGQVKAVSASPDGTRLYIGGDFTTVDGQTRNRVAGFDLTNNGQLLSGFTNGLDAEVLKLSATNNGVYVGGWFNNSTSTGSQEHLAYYDKSGNLSATWKPQVDTNGFVDALIAETDRNILVVGGGFTSIGGSSYPGLGAVNLTTGAPIAWASQQAGYPIHTDDDSSSAIDSLKYDGSQVYVAGYVFLDAAGNRHGTLEGTAAISPTDGHIIWLNDCHGDTYDTMPIGSVLYLVGHPHDCSTAGYFPEVAGVYHRALAETITPNGGHDTQTSNGYPNFAGQPTSGQLNWYPDLGAGTYTGTYQAAWSITGNSSYISLGGEFPTAGNTAQQGLVRFGIASVAPNKVGPVFTGYNAVGFAPDQNGSGSINVTTAYDEDNVMMTYSVYRDNMTTPIKTFTASNSFWNTQTINVPDTGLTTGSFHMYRVVATDPFGNTATTTNLIDDTNPGINYSANWTNSQGARGYGDYWTGIHYTAANGSTASYAFAGSGISLITEHGPDRGNIGVSIDGGTPTTVSAYAAGVSSQQTTYTSPLLAPGTHTITITKLSGNYADLDGFKVNTAGVYDDTDPAVSYTGTWTNVQNKGSGDLDNGIHYTTLNGATSKLTFTGTGVTLLTEENTDRGNISVSIDGGTPVVVNVYAPSFVAQQKVFSKTGLSSGTHTIVETKLSGTYMDLDAFLVTP